MAAAVAAAVAAIAGSLQPSARNEHEKRRSNAAFFFARPLSAEILSRTIAAVTDEPRQSSLNITRARYRQMA
jgi:hypothetical protein